MAIFVMLNNFFHDFSVAVLFACLMVLWFVHRMMAAEPSGELRAFYRDLYRWMNRLIIGAWVWIIVGGIIRTLAYEDYEWMEAAGKGQVAALVIKHILLVSFVVGGTWLQIRLKKTLREPDATTS